jgi:anti-sigma factor RsiW
MMNGMPSLWCLWVRRSLDPYVDGALSPSTARRVERHLGGCAACTAQTGQAKALRGLVKSAVLHPAEPDWAGFWTGVRLGIAKGSPPPVRDPWWFPLWRPVWGHPRLALSGALAAGLALTLSLWPVDDDGGLSSAWADPVVVQDVSTPDPEHTVMVYSSPDRSLTVIWLFPPTDSSR